MQAFDSTIAASRKPDLDKATLRPQSYGIACAQVSFGGPRGIWLECKGCNRADTIGGSRFIDEDPYANIGNADAAYIFRRHGWTGDGENMTNAHCAGCSQHTQRNGE